MDTRARLVVLTPISLTHTSSSTLRELECKAPFGTVLAREKTALALVHTEKQLFLALTYLYENVW